MKKAALISFALFLVALIYSSCTEDSYMDWKLRNDRWYEANKDDTAFVRTASGLCYKVIHQGTGRHPDKNSYIVATYTGKLIDGYTFDSDSASSLGAISGLVPGFQEGLKKMQNGGHYIFYIPSTLGYGESTDNSSIPPHSNLIFDVVLNYSY